MRFNGEGASRVGFGFRIVVLQEHNRLAEPTPCRGAKSAFTSGGVLLAELELRGSHDAEDDEVEILSEGADGAAGLRDRLKVQELAARDKAFDAIYNEEVRGFRRMRDRIIAHVAPEERFKRDAQGDVHPIEHVVNGGDGAVEGDVGGGGRYRTAPGEKGARGFELLKELHEDSGFASAGRPREKIERAEGEKIVNEEFARGISAFTACHNVCLQVERFNFKPGARHRTR